MQLNGPELFNAFAVTGVVCMLFAAHGFHANPGIDPTTTASVPAVRPLEGNRFVVINHLNNESCVMALHRADGYAVHRLEPAHNCAAVGNEFAVARAWQETKQGEVTVTDHRGNQVMKLVRSDGFEWEVVKPARIQASLAAY
ncbi:MAG: AprI/Inh family metalloprotease inhibitor [Pseudomonadota bacterium]